MLIYEKDNKLNINFDNEVNENPDLQISKEDGKTEVLIDGQPGGSSGGGGIECMITETEPNVYTCNMTQAEIESAMSNNANIHFVLSRVDGAKMFCVCAISKDKGVSLGFVNNNAAVGVVFYLAKVSGSSVTVTDKTIS